MEEHKPNLVLATLFELLRTGLHPGRELRLPKPAEEAVWDEVYRTACTQGVAAFAWDGMSDEVRASLPQRLRLQWALHVERTEELYARQRRTLGRLAAFFTRHGIPVMGLKGYAASLCYPRPEHRPCGDIDIWLYGRQAEGDELLRREKGVEICEEKHHHTTFVAGGILVENHYDFVEIHSHASNRRLERRLQELARREGGTADIDGAPLRLPPADFNALFLLRHAAMHFAAIKIGLRHVADWALFAERYGAEVDWQELYRLARRMNMHRFLSCMNALAVELLGTPPQTFPLPLERDAELERRFLGELLAPEFDRAKPQGSTLSIVIFKTRRWWANRWKHRIVYNDSLLVTFFRSSWSHLLKPRSIRS